MIFTENEKREIYFKLYKIINYGINDEAIKASRVIAEFEKVEAIKEFTQIIKDMNEQKF